MQWLADIVWLMFAPILNNTIVMWSGTIATIPDGWVLCDGNNGTPDLRDKFVVGAQEDIDGLPQAFLQGGFHPNGDQDEHGHAYTETFHNHDRLGGYYVEPGSSNEVWDGIPPNNETYNYDPTGTTDHNTTVVVPFFSLAYIMKLPV